MNNMINKEKRKVYVTDLMAMMRLGRQVVWLDETNFNLFLRQNCGRSRIGSRAVSTLPASRGPNVHVIGAISNNAVLKMELKRGSFTS